MNRVVPSVLLALTLSACAALPKDLPAHPALRQPATARTLADLRTEPGPATASGGAWWTSFGVPELNRLIDTALRDQPDLAAAAARLRRAQQAERLARLQAEPGYDTEASIVREHLSENGLFPPPLGGSTFTQSDLTQNLSYSLDWWGRNRSLIDAAGNAREAAAEEAAAVRLTIAAAVADTYFAEAGVEQRLRVAREREASHRKERDLLKSRFALGLDSAQPSIDARRKLDLDEDLIHALEYQARSLRYRLSALIGADPDQADALPSPELPARLPPLPAGLPLDWLSVRPDIAALRSRVEAASDLSDAAKADFYPNLDVRLMIGLQTLDLAKLFRAGSLTGSVGPALHLPLFNGRTLRATLRMREADYAAAAAAYNGAILEAARQAADAYALTTSLERRSQTLGQALRETEQTRNLVRQRRRIGLAAPLDSLEADGAVLDQRMNDIDLQAARLRARVALYRALGGDAFHGNPTP